MKTAGRCRKMLRETAGKIRGLCHPNIEKKTSDLGGKIKLLKMYKEKEITKMKLKEIGFICKTEGL